MIAKSNGIESAYLYVQNLDNSGDTLCWRSRALGEYQELDYGDPQRGAVLHSLDYLQHNGRQWSVGYGGVDCRVTYRGDCLIKINPLTRDVSGRAAPVILLFNAFGERRKNVARMLFDCEALMQRELSAEHRVAIGHFDKVMNWPVFLIMLHVIFYSRKCIDD
jgi:hypothetical protein